MKFHIHPEVRIRLVTRGARSHFFGYYDKCPWDATGRYLLALETDLTTQPPGPDDVAMIGMIDTTQNDAWHPLAQTHAWNWQTGARLHWMPSDPGRQIIYNIREKLTHYNLLEIRRD